MSSGRFDSLAAKHDLAQELGLAECAEVLHIGDHDPSGVHRLLGLSEVTDVQGMARREAWHVVRLAHAV